ncbi:MAG TPA: DEAD/DEAH box helicase [Bryobacteraceae bacterium]|nr:DEAD/DEAH box helicase [Bryobacteraceae bacterium]
MHASVSGGNQYDVRVTLDHGRLLVSCDCVYFSEYGKCKHLWATILEADRRGALSEAMNAKYLTIEDNLSPDDPTGFGDVSDRDRLPRRPRLPPPQPPRIPAWQEHLTAIQREIQHKQPLATWPREFEILYVIDAPASRASGAIVLELFSRTRKKTGEWSAQKGFKVSPAQAGSLPDPVDAEVVGAMLGGMEAYSYYSANGSSTRKTLPAALALKIIPTIASTGRLRLRTDLSAKDSPPLLWDSGEPWKFYLDVRQGEGEQWSIQGSLRRGDERMDVHEPLLLLECGLLVTPGLIARFDTAGGFPWVTRLRGLKRIAFLDSERDKVLEALLESPVVPPLVLDDALHFEERRVQPRLGLRIKQQRSSLGEESFQAHLLLDYGQGWLEDTASGSGVWLRDQRVYVLRDKQSESAARETLTALGLRHVNTGRPHWRLAMKPMPRVVRELLRSGWHVEAEGKAFLQAGPPRVDVSSGIDWFELRAEVDYGDTTINLPVLLEAMRRGDNMVPLGDGSFGLLPEEWLSRFAPLAGLGTKEEGHLRFRRNQAGLLDALLAAQPEVHVDEMFARVREGLHRFQGVRAAPQPEGFVGTLRDYQREGVGWMEFLREFGFGGCLADDMGVGKTAQVLAVLEARRSEGRGPSLVVAPKSLMFNWRAEAARFTPHLRVLEHTGLTRDVKKISKHDLILSTYGTLLRDAPQLAGVKFDYVVLDEAQAVKNASTASAKAVRLLHGEHRLALSGTPVENHLGELWSLFEFLNPGMLGEAKVLKLAGGLARNPSEDARLLLAQALRPFILRRTKQQVARELPEKTEQTIFCELEANERKQYEELRKHYRASLLKRVTEDGLGKSKMHLLEALLRLRQAACHPGLLDPKRVGDPSAKLELLLQQLDELREEGHQALVFSQFTSLLAIVRARLDAAGVKYEYLDGATRDRQERVAAFQNDPQCSVFLISLKAGGLGLNLTAAEYVFLLDPWWNPAVEAQAIDRAHRIGQTRPVFAYRLIARDTVEEKVLELQKTKRDLADAILGGDSSLIRDLKREDLELLLS